MIGASKVLLGSVSGITAALLNPFTVGIAQGIAELPLYSGKAYRLLMWMIMVSMTIARSMFKAKKIGTLRQEGKLVEEDIELTNYQDETYSLKDVVFTTRQKLILVIFTLTILFLAIGVTKFGWYIMEIASLFLLSGIIMGIIGKMNYNE